MKCVFVFATILVVALSASAGWADSFAWFDGFLLGKYIKDKSEWVSGDPLQGGDPKYHLERYWGGEECKVYSSAGYEGIGIAEAVKQDHPQEFGSKSVGYSSPLLDIERRDGKKSEKLSIGSARLAVWGDGFDAMPRRATPLGPESETYKKIVKEYLAKRGLKNATPRITQIFKVDLEGDGVDEVVIYAQNIFDAKKDAATWRTDASPWLSGEALLPPAISKKGDYSVAFLRKIVGGKVREIPLFEYIGTGGGEATFLHKICGFADLNGDGKLEIIANWRFSQGFSYEVYEVEGGEAKPVLSVGLEV
ncbi:hypothetical protein LJC31_04900 [Synergistaceae bacterium OttesenSCG-928-I11]|nr:hypothetical protein [Synergistaceae bacterium OttesenSCG-928-I11]